MAFAETRFPTDISFGSSGGPEYSTAVVELASGYEQRNVNWAEARARYNVAHGVKTQAQLDALIAFFLARKGRAHGFRFKDWTDFAVQGQLIGTGDGVTTEFQLLKSYVNSVVESRTITKVVAGTAKIYVNGTLQMSGVTVDNTTGIVTFAAAPVSGTSITADFEFDVPVRFDTDRLSASIEEYGITSWLDIPLVEVRI